MGYRDSAVEIGLETRIAQAGQIGPGRNPEGVRGTPIQYRDRLPWPGEKDGCPLRPALRPVGAPRRTACELHSAGVNS